MKESAVRDSLFGVPVSTSPNVLADQLHLALGTGEAGSSSFLANNGPNL